MCTVRNQQRESSPHFFERLESKKHPDKLLYDKLPKTPRCLEGLVTCTRQYRQSASHGATPARVPDGKPLSKNSPTSRVTVSVDGISHEFSAILLRDLCQCPACVHEFTNQKLYSTTDIPTNIQTRSVNPSKSSPDAIDILWSQDVPGFDSSHTTTLKLDTLRSINQSGVITSPFQKPMPPPSSWEEGSPQQLDFDYDSYMQDDSTLFEVIQKLQTYGLVFVTNVPGIEKSVSTIAERIGPIKDTFYGHTWDGQYFRDLASSDHLLTRKIVRTVPKAINAAYTSNDLGFHTDLLYFANPPHVQLLHCIQSSSSGGASVFADAFRAASDLYQTDMNAFNLLASLPVTYHYNHPSSNLYSATKPVFDMRPLQVGDTTYSTLAAFLEAWEINRHKIKQSTGTELPTLSPSDCFEKINWGPPFLAPFSLQQESIEQAGRFITARECLSQKMDEWHAAAKKFSDLIHRPNTLYERLMKPGECVLFNNTRVLHSRRAFNADDVGRARWLRGTYVDKDPFYSRLRVLNQRYESQ